LKTLSFALERLESNQPLPLEPRIREPLGIRVLFWCTDTAHHELEVVAQTPDSTRLELGAFEGRCPAAPGILTMEGELRGFEIAGWHRVRLILDGEDPGHSVAVFVLGSGRAVSTFLERTAVLPMRAERSVPRPADPRASKPLAGLAVLVVEDDMDSRDALGDWLHHFGARVTLAASGAEGCEKALTHPCPDVIVTDVMMPGMNGHQLATHIQGHLGLADIPIIALTGDSRVESSDHAFDAVLLKPKPARSIVDTILDVLQRRRRLA
jgi:CheY-like chemotaxis protein